MYNEKHNPAGSNEAGLENKQRPCPVGVDVIVKCFFDFPFVFFSWITGIRIRPEDTGKVERVLLFIAFIILCFGFGRLLYALLQSIHLGHNLLFSENKGFMVGK